MPIAITCRCGYNISAPERLAGRTLRCPKCLGEFTVPQPAMAPPPPVPEPMAAPPIAALSETADMMAPDLASPVGDLPMEQPFGAAPDLAAAELGPPAGVEPAPGIDELETLAAEPPMQDDALAFGDEQPVEPAAQDADFAAMGDDELGLLLMEDDQPPPKKKK